MMYPNKRMQMFRVERDGAEIHTTNVRRIAEEVAGRYSGAVVREISMDEALRVRRVYRTDRPVRQVVGKRGRRGPRAVAPPDGFVTTEWVARRWKISTNGVVSRCRSNGVEFVRLGQVMPDSVIPMAKLWRMVDIERIETQRSDERAFRGAKR